MKLTKEVLLKQGEGESFWVLGDLYTFKVTGEQSNGAYTVVSQIIQPQNGPPPHIHHREDESFYVLEGKFSFLCGNEQRIFEAGSFVYVPKGTVHTFKNIGEQPGKLLVIITPAGLEEFFYKIGTPAQDPDSPPAFDPGIIEKVIKLSKDYHMDIVLPEKE
jgi:mannose-6-phosphate isomerase-like protein (cupin superfamily)